MRKALRYVRAHARVIDIGAHQGELFQALGNRLQTGFGIEPVITVPIKSSTYAIYPGFFPSVRPSDPGWDAITMLAVLEHVPRAEQTALVKSCHELLKIGGRVIITVPSEAVDSVLAILKFMRLIDGMSLEEHFGFKPDETPRLFSSPQFKLIRHERFQMGLNHLYVFEKTADPAV